MADIADLLKNILDDPSTSEKLQSLLGGGSAVSAAPAAPSIDPVMLAKITKAMKHMNSEQSDNRTRLLRDLKPYISPARAKRVDEAIDILKMLWLVDIFKEEKGDD